MELTQKILVLYAGQYSVMDESTRELKEGVSVSYLYGDSLDVVEGKNFKGQRPAKASFPLSAWESFSTVPAIYDGYFKATIGSDGKLVLRLDGVRFHSVATIYSVSDDIKSGKKEVPEFPRETKK